MIMQTPGGDRERIKNKPIRLSRNQKHQDTKRRLFAAAIKIVGRYGYAGASVARITAEAGIAQGTFYLHFDNRQELLDQLLPTVGQEIAELVRERMHESFSEEDREIERCRVFFEVLHEIPEFFRIITEAEMFAPDSYRRHIGGIIANYARTLKRGFDPDDQDGYSDDELEVIVHILLGARACLGKQYAGPENDSPAVPEHVISAYGKFIRRGLFPKKTPSQTAS
jgi:AcrR family transcriptional regulator